MDVTCSLINKHAVYCGFLDLLYQVEQVLFLELLIFFNIERMLAFYQIIFSMSVEVIFFLSRSVKRSQIFTFKSESYFLSFQNFIVHVRVLIKSTLHSLLSNSSHPPHTHPHLSQSHALFCKAY